MEICNELKISDIYVGMEFEDVFDDTVCRCKTVEKIEDKVFKLVYKDIHNQFTQSGVYTLEEINRMLTTGLWISKESYNLDWRSTSSGVAFEIDGYEAVSKRLTGKTNLVCVYNIYTYHMSCTLEIRIGSPTTFYDRLRSFSTKINYLTINDAQKDAGIFDALELPKLLRLFRLYEKH